MRKYAFPITLSTFVVGIFGFFLRWLQTLNGFEENGLAIPGATISTVFLIYSLLAAAAFIVIARIFFGKGKAATAAAEAIRPENPIPGLVMWVVAALMAIACLVLMFSSDFARYPTMQRLMSALGIFAAVSLPFLIRRKDDSDGSTASILSLIPVVFGCMWLVTAYRIESENPVLWSYVLEVLGIIAATLSFYYISAYFFNRAQPVRGFALLQIAVYLCMCTLMDEHSGMEKLLFGCLAAAFLVFEFVLLRSLKDEDAESKTE